MSVLTVAVQYYYEVTLGAVVPAALFSPPPKVDSQVLILNRRETLPYGEDKMKAFFRVVKAGFGERRKKLSNSIAGGLHMDKEAATTLLTQAGIDPDLRAQNLSLDEWYRLFEVIEGQQA
jgi:16S rRNA (adenine1518-N6/adenine1519-N6)-dimethyltransferase